MIGKTPGNTAVLEPPPAQAEERVLEDSSYANPAVRSPYRGGSGQDYLVPRRGGFTFTEMLILLGVMTLIIITVFPVYSYMSEGRQVEGALFSQPAGLQADARAEAAELATVQHAMDAMMANQNLSVIEPSPMEGTDIFEEFPAGDGAVPLYPGYLPVDAGLTNCVYMWDRMGQVYQFTCP